jgi:Fic family protein
MANLFAKAVDSPAQDELGSRALITNGLEADNLRKQHQHFRSPEPYIKGDNRVFPTIAPYMIPSRLNELIAWTNKNLSDELEHPLLTIAAFHLVFLQISPFPTANHRIAIMLTWGMLAAHGYGFVRLNHYSPIWKNRAAEYFQALHQAEKTSFESWNTLNIWLEFFLETLHESVSKLLEESQTIQRTKRLTEVQQQLLASIRHHGFARRELLSKETGIKLSTVKYNLSVLQSRGLIQLIGAGRTAGYQVAK